MSDIILNALAGMFGIALGCGIVTSLREVLRFLTKEQRNVEVAREVRRLAMEALRREWARAATTNLVGKVETTE